MTFAPPPAAGPTDPWLTCPGCTSDLLADPGFQTWRVCSSCGRHFSIPADDRVALLADDGSFHSLAAGTDPAALATPATTALDRLAGVEERPLLDNAIVTGTATLGTHRIAIIALDDQLMGTHPGVLGAEKIVGALEYALEKQLPVIIAMAGGRSTSIAPGPLASVQQHRLAIMMANLQYAGLAIIGVITHPTPGPLFAAIASQCDYLVAEPGATVGVFWTAPSSLDSLLHAVSATDLLTMGWVDGIIPRNQQRDRLIDVLDVLDHASLDPVPPRQAPPELALGRAFPRLTRLVGNHNQPDDPQLRTAIGWFGDRPAAVAWQDPAAPAGSDPVAALGTLRRLARLAGRFALPLIMIANAPAAREPEMLPPGDAFVAGKLNTTLALLPVPIVSLAVGPIHGQLATTIMTGDRRHMLTTAACYLATDLQPMRGRNPAQQTTWPAIECQRLGMIDEVIERATADDWADDPAIIRTLEESLRLLERRGSRALVEQRQRRARRADQPSEAGLAAIRWEIAEWADIQRSVRGSLDDLRASIEKRLPADVRPGLGEIVARLRHQQQSLRPDRLELSDAMARLRERRDDWQDELRQRIFRLNHPHDDTQERNQE